VVVSNEALAEARAALFAKARYSDIPTGVFTDLVDRFERTVRASERAVWLCRCGRPLKTAFAGVPDLAIYTRWHDPDRPESHVPEPTIEPASAPTPTDSGGSK
jgi:hypothetical protein